LYNNKKSKNLALNIELLFFVIFFIFVNWTFQDLRANFMAQMFSSSNLFLWMVFTMFLLDIIPFYFVDRIPTGVLVLKIFYMILKSIIVFLGLFMSFSIIAYHL